MAIGVVLVSRCPDGGTTREVCRAGAAIASGSPCGAKHVGAGKSQVHDVVSTPEPVPTAQERAPNVGVRPSGRNVLLCDGLSDGVDCEGTPSPRHDREPGQSPDHDRGDTPAKSGQTVEA